MPKPWQPLNVLMAADQARTSQARYSAFLPPPPTRLSSEAATAPGIVLVAAAAFALAGCASSESETQALFRADDAKCKRYGPGTDAYVQCRLAIDIQRANTEAAAATAPRR